MSRRPPRRRRPSMLFAGSLVEALEPRQLLTGGTVSVQALSADVEEVPSGCCALLPGTFVISSTGSGYTNTISYTLTASPVNALYQDAYDTTQLSSSGNLSLIAGQSCNFIIYPPRYADGVDDVATLTLTGVTSCGTGFSIGSPSSDTITFHYPAVAKKCPACDPGPLAVTASPGTGDDTPSVLSDAGVAYGSGGVSPRAPSLLESDGYGTIPLGVDLGWTNLAGFAPPGTSTPFGNHMIDPDLPYLEPGYDGQVVAVEDAANGIFFNYNAANSTYSVEFYSQDTLVANGSDLKLTQSDGTVIDYYGFGGSVATALQGKLNYYTDAGGYTTTAGYNMSSGQLTSVSRTDGSSSETYAYTYISGGVNAGRVSNIQLERTPAGQAQYTVRQVAFTYYGGTYTGSDAFGNAGDLQSETLEDAAATPNHLGTTYYRYYTPSDLRAGGAGYLHALKYQLDPQSFARLVAAASSDPTMSAVPDSTVATYADQYYEYDAWQRVTKTVVQGAGCSCTGSPGQGTYT